MKGSSEGPMGALSARALKAVALCTIFALCACQQAPKPPAPAKPGPSAEELERWHQTIVHTKRPEKACFTAEYPATTWTATPCGTPPKVPFLPSGGPRSLTVGNRNDFAAQAASGNISRAEGSFDSVQGVKSACSVQCPKGKCPACNSSDVKNDYSLQLNSNTFPTSACKGHSKCQGWQQFIFTNRACQVSALPACAFIQYWLKGYGTNCPSNWQSDNHGNCQIDSQNSVNFLPFLVDDLGFMKLTGEVPGVDGRDDLITFTYGTKAYSAPGDDRLPGLGQNWQVAEFNVFGDGGLSQVVLNPGSTLVVRTLVDSGTVSAPQCTAPGNGGTGETNNLNLTGLQTHPVNAPIDAVSTQPGNVNGGPWAKGPGPALIFAESNAADAIPAGCAGTVAVGGTN